MVDKKLNDPTTTIVVISDDGHIYKLTKEYWSKGEELKGDAQFLPEQVRRSGGFIAFPDPIAVGIGVECTIVNLEAVLKSQGAAPAGPHATLTDFSPSALLARVDSPWRVADHRQSPGRRPTCSRCEDGTPRPPCWR